MTLAYHIWFKGLSLRDIYDPDRMLIFGVKIIFIGFLTRLHVPVTAFLYFDIVIPYFALECITIGWSVTYIHDLCITFNFDLNIKSGFSQWIFVYARSFLLFYIGIPNLAPFASCFICFRLDVSFSWCTEFGKEIIF